MAHWPEATSQWQAIFYVHHQTFNLVITPALQERQLCSWFLHHSPPWNLCFYNSRTPSHASNPRCRKFNISIPTSPCDHGSFIIWHVGLLPGLHGLATCALIFQSVKYSHESFWFIFPGFLGNTASSSVMVAHQICILCFTCSGWVASTAYRFTCQENYVDNEEITALELR